jgi:hypothetical protein
MRFFFLKNPNSIKIFFFLILKFYIVCRITYLTKFKVINIKEKCRNIKLKIKESDESFRIFLQDTVPLEVQLFHPKHKNTYIL